MWVCFFFYIYRCYVLAEYFYSIRCSSRSIWYASSLQEIWLCIINTILMLQNHIVSAYATNMERYMYLKTEYCGVSGETPCAMSYVRRERGGVQCRKWQGPPWVVFSQWRLRGGMHAVSPVGWCVMLQWHYDGGFHMMMAFSLWCGLFLMDIALYFFIY